MSLFNEQKNICSHQIPLIICPVGEDVKYLILVVLKDILIMVAALRTTTKSHKNVTLELFQENKNVENAGRYRQTHTGNPRGGSQEEEP